MSKRWKIIVALLALVALAWGVAVRHSEDGTPWWETIGIFPAVYGFIGCLVIVLVSKLLGKWLLQRREDYYDDV